MEQEHRLAVLRSSLEHAKRHAPSLDLSLADRAAHDVPEQRAEHRVGEPMPPVHHAPGADRDHIAIDHRLGRVEREAMGEKARAPHRVRDMTAEEGVLVPVSRARHVEIEGVVG